MRLLFLTISKYLTMCNCLNVSIGSYANQTIIQYPDWFVSEKKIRAAGIDNCILEEIKQLWESGIQTSESCCGHNVAPAYISVIDTHIPKMLEHGYENLILIGQPSFDERGFRADVFKPKSV